LALFLNKSQEKIESNTIRTPDPTSVEFQLIFGELVGEALEDSKRRMLIVVDNLDRVEPKDALAIWATLKTFFDFDAHADASCLARLWLLLPFDETAIRKLWTGGSNLRGGNANTSAESGAELGQSFIDKTFQITFRVSPPVLSDWQEFLKRQLKEAFPGHGDEDFHAVYRIFDLCAVVASKPPTPRDIKIFVNRVGAIHRQWGDDIALTIQALYAVLSKAGSNLAEDLALKKDEEILRNVPVDMVGKDWRGSLAAIHFNVPKERALQVVIGGQLKDCLSSGDEEKLKQLAAIPGFTGVLEKQMEEDSQNWDKGETGSLAISASILARVPEADDSSWTRTWDLLCGGAEKVTYWSKFDARVVDGIIQIYKRSPGPERLDKVTRSISASFQRLDPLTVGHIEVWLDGVFAWLAAGKDEHGPAIEKALTVPAEPEIYLRVVVVATNKDKSNEFIRYLRPTADRPAIVAEFSKMVAQGKFDDGHAKAMMAVRTISGEWPLQGLAEAISSRLSTSDNLPIPEVGTLLSTLINLESTVPEAKKSLETLSQTGYISHHLSYVAKDPRVTALCMLPLLETIPGGNLQSAATPASTTGITIYNQILEAPDKRKNTIAELANLIIMNEKFDLLYHAPAKAPTTAPFLHAALNQIASRERAHEYIPPDRLIQNKDFIKGALGSELFESLVAQSVAKASLTSKLSGQTFDLKHLDIYRAALRVDKKNPHYVEFLISGLKSLEKPTWVAALASESELLDLLLEIRESGGRTDLAIEFEDALLNHAQQLVDGAVKVERLHSRWQSVFEGLEQDLQSATLKKMLEILCISQKPTDSLLGLYGELLASPSVLSSNKERLALHAFPFFMDRLRLVELQWVCSVLEKNLNFLTEVSSSTRLDLHARIVSAAEQPTIGEEIRNAILRLAKLASVDLSKPQPPSEVAGDIANPDKQ